MILIYNGINLHIIVLKLMKAIIFLNKIKYLAEINIKKELFHNKIIIM